MLISSNRFLVPYCDVHQNETDYPKEKHCRAETWFNPLVVGWMEAALNVSLQSIVRKVQDLSRLNDWSSPALVTKHKSVVKVTLQGQKKTKKKQ